MTATEDFLSELTESITQGIGRHGNSCPTEIFKIFQFFWLPQVQP